ncbi:hypothetical protein CEXT_162541 [Caerostris extrusa]|uniref:Uncharacterized protein n=1 Tax=Caerostris extrusa TaxID=172846 RepID=A0AAV4M8D3_CAEEX|nr:hypothetical protein CEXT_162541 [Caerostris extrusa]
MLSYIVRIEGKGKKCRTGTAEMLNSFVGATRDLEEFPMPTMKREKLYPGEGIESGTPFLPPSLIDPDIKGT